MAKMRMTFLTLALILTACTVNAATRKSSPMESLIYSVGIARGLAIGHEISARRHKKGQKRLVCVPVSKLKHGFDKEIAQILLLRMKNKKKITPGAILAVLRKNYPCK